MKVADMEGALLDYWVARAEGWTVDPSGPFKPVRMRKPSSFGDYSEGRFIGISGVVDRVCVIGRSPETSAEAVFEPSSEWNHGGPIIERERIDIQHGGWEWGAWRGSNPFWEPIGEAFGQTPLIAAMRSYVARKFGDEVSDSAD